MEISDLTIKLIILLIPGILSALIIEQITVHQKWTQFKFILYSILLGFASYFMYDQFLKLSLFIEYLLNSNTNFVSIRFWDSLFDAKIPVSLKEVFIACLYSVFIGLIISACIHYKLLHRLAIFLKISDKYGDENLFTFFMNAKEVNWIWVRDPVRGLTYEGLRESFSESDNVRELVLRDVKVYNYEDSEFLYEVPAIYLSYKIGDLAIEAPLYKREEIKDGKTK